MAGHVYNACSRFGNKFVDSTRQFAEIAMKSIPEQETPPRTEAANALRNWVMSAITSLFVLFYGAALMGWLKPLPDERVIARLEPIIFVIIGYYFGRLPAQQNEQTLKGELSRQTQRADAAQHAKEQMQQTREALEEKVKNASVTLTSSATGAAKRDFAGASDEIAVPAQADALRQRVIAAINILNS